MNVISGPVVLQRRVRFGSPVEVSAITVQFGRRLVNVCGAVSSWPYRLAAGLRR